MRRIAICLAVAVGLMMLAAAPTLAGKPAPALPPGGLTTQSCPAGEKVVSGKAVYSFKGKNKVTVTSYIAGGFNAFNEPTTATFTTPIEPRFDTVNITLVCAPATVAPPDTDSDGVPNTSDNCPTIHNSNQSDVDGDGIGDACDPVNDADRDWDGIPNAQDSCPDEAGPVGSQGCPDADGDGVPDITDNCPNYYSTDQADEDGDGFGNPCDPVNSIDGDRDGVLNVSDNCLMDYNPNQLDTDGDGLGDVCDQDDDGDDTPDSLDNCVGVYNPNQSDNDGDGIGNHCDSDTLRVIHVESGYLTLEDGTGFDLLCPANYYHDTSTLVLNFPSGINWNVITRSDGDGYLYGVRVENRVFANDLPVAYSGSFGFDCTLI